MGDERITVEKLIEWLGKLPAEAEVCFMPPGMAEGTSRSLKEITVRPINAKSPYTTDNSTPVKNLVILTLE